MGVNCSKTCSSEEEDKETLIRRVRRSCGHWAVKKGITDDVETGKDESDSKQNCELPVKEEVFKQEFAYTCGGGQDTTDNKVEVVNTEVDLSEVIKHLVIEAQKKKNASRPNSRIFKDLQTESGYISMKTNIQKNEEAKNKKQIEENISSPIKEVAETLGNARVVNTKEGANYSINTGDREEGTVFSQFDEIGNSLNEKDTDASMTKNKDDQIEIESFISSMIKDLLDSLFVQNKDV